MSTIKLKTKSDLENFLRILAEESVMSAQAGMNNPRPPEQSRQKSIIQQIKKSKASLSEDDPEKTPPETAPAEEPAAEPAPASPPPAKTPAAATSDDFNPSVSGLVDAIKDIRGGRGASDSAVEAELTSYFDRLEQAERTALIVMLRSIGGIMRQQLTGADAKEPTDYNIFTTSKPAETTPAAAPAAEPKAAVVAPSAGGAEDSSPPIKVGEPVSESYRAKIRDLLARSS